LAALAGLAVQLLFWSSFVSVRPRLEGAIDYVSFVSQLFLVSWRLGG